jgi:plastocyanin
VRTALVVAATAALVAGVAAPFAAGTALPTASLSVSPAPAEPGETVTLDATASTGNDSVDRCEFDVDGDGTYELIEDDCLGTWTYDETGTYNVSVLVFDGDWTDTDSRLLTVSEPPTVDLSFDPTAPAAGEEVTFDAVAEDPDGEVTDYVWYVDGEFASETAGPTFQWTFSSTGSHLVTVAVFDDAGHRVTREVTVDVQGTATPTPTETPTPVPTAANEPPTVEFTTGTADPVAGEAAEFRAAFDDPDGAVVNVTWRVDGDPVPAAGQDALTWTFDAGGDHEVGVVVTDDDGATVGEALTVSVAEEDATELPPGTDAPTDIPTDDLPGGIVPLALGGSVALLGLGVVGFKLFGGDSAAATGGSATGGGATGSASGSTSRAAGHSGAQKGTTRGDGQSGSGGDGQSGSGGDRIRERLEREVKDELKDEAKDRLGDDEETIVYVRQSGFDPVRTSVDPGTTVRWINVDDRPHAVEPARATERAAAWTLTEGDLDPATMTDHEFEEPGVYEYRCPDCGGEAACGVVLVGDVDLAATLPCEDGPSN